MYACIYMYMYCMYMYICMSVCLYVHIYVCMCKCVLAFSAFGIITYKYYCTSLFVKLMLWH